MIGGENQAHFWDFLTFSGDRARCEDKLTIRLDEDDATGEYAWRKNLGYLDGWKVRVKPDGVEFRLLDRKLQKKVGCEKDNALKIGTAPSGYVPT